MSQTPPMREDDFAFLETEGRRGGGGGGGGGVVWRVLIAGLVAVAIAMSCVGGFFAGMAATIAGYAGAGPLDFLAEEWADLELPPGVATGILYPDSVRVGETFDIEVSVRNDGTEDVYYTLVEFPAEVLEGVRIDGVTPTALRINDGASGYGWRGYAYRLRVRPGEEQIVRFEVTAERAGSYVGSVDVYVGDEGAYESWWMEMEVGERE